MVQRAYSASAVPVIMMLGFLSAGFMLITFLLEETVLVILPLPWRLIPVTFIFSLALMHRVSFELGAIFFFAATCAAVASGLAPFSTLLVALVSLGAAYGFMSRIFARRSLPAFTGLALVTSLIYFILRFGVVSHVPGFFPWMYLFLASMTALLAVISSLALEWTLKAFGRRFVTKNETYEVQAPR